MTAPVNAKATARSAEYASVQAHKKVLRAMRAEGFAVDEVSVSPCGIITARTFTPGSANASVPQTDFDLWADKL